MLAVFKALVVFGLVACVGVVASFVYGMLAHFFDLFILFPFVIAGVIVSVGATVARWMHLKQGALLVLVGLLVGVAAYPAYLSGKYVMLVAEFMQGTPTQFASFPWSTEPFATLRGASLESFAAAAARTDKALRQQVGTDGLVGQLWINMGAGIPVRTKMLGEGNYVFGGLVELFKFGILVFVSGSALRDTVKAEALVRVDRRQRVIPRRLTGEEEELWGKGE